MNIKSNDNIIDPVNQLYLYGYSKYFNLLKKLFENKKLPNCILLSGSKGIGKSTFAHHFINSLFSIDEKYEYSAKEFKINSDNISYNQVLTNTHPNFFKITNTEGEQIKIEQIRNLLKFLNKTTYSKNLKIVLIDNFENLNLNSTNALLKAIEEPDTNTFFFIVHNHGTQILETIKSRCLEFKIHFSEIEKKNILLSILKDYKEELDVYNFESYLHFETPGNILRYLVLLNNSKNKINDDTLSYIYFFLDNYINTKSSSNLSYISCFIEKFYNELCIKNYTMFNFYSHNYSKILNQINYIKKYNLHEKNTLIWIKDILLNEKR